MDILKKYFYGLLTPEQEREVQVWLVEHGEDPQVVSELENIMSDLQKPDSDLSSAAFNKVKSRLGLREGRGTKVLKKILRYTAYAAVLVLLPLAGALLHGLYEPEPEWIEVRVPYGQTEEVLLADGTRMYLNSGSRLTYPTGFKGKERKVFVEGEVFAEVATDPERPFVISSSDISVQVLGTTFDFKAYDDSECVELCLLEGKVRMDVLSDKRSRKVHLEPGQMVQYDRSTGDFKIKNVDPLQYRGFHEDGAIHFFNLKLSDIAADLQRRFGTEIVLLDESIAETRYFAWFTNNETLEQILQSLNAEGKMTYGHRNGKIYIKCK